MLQLKKYDLTQYPEKLGNRPLLFWHGKLDEVVPYRYSHQFFEKIKNKSSQVKYNLLRMRELTIRLAEKGY